jgi:HEAT repeat protein
MGEGAKDGSWETWWGYNKDGYLQLKRAIHTVQVYTPEFPGSGTGAIPTLRPSEETIRNKIVPALKHALATERSNDIVTGSLIALAKIGDVVSGEDGSSEFGPLFVPFLKDPNQEIAETAAVAFGILGSQSSFTTLKALALDAPEGRALVGAGEVPFRTRAFATYGLGLLGPRTNDDLLHKEIVRTLVEIIESPNASTRDVKVAGVIALGLVDLKWDGESALETSRDPSLSRQAELRWLAAKLDDTKLHEQVRAHVPTAIARLLSGASEDLRCATIASFLDVIAPHAKYDKPVRQSTVIALGTLARLGDGDVDAKALAALGEIIKEKRDDMQTRDFAAIALAEIGGRGTGDAAEEQRRALRTFLLEQASRGDSHMRPWAGLAVGVMERAVNDAGGTTPLGVRESMRSLFAAAKAPDAVGSLAISLGIARDVESSTLLSARLADSGEPIVQGYLCVALGLVDDRKSIKGIRAVIKSSKFKPELLRQAAIGLGLLGDKDVVPELVDMLGAAQGFSSQAAIASALGFIGDARSIDPLVAMLDKDSGRSDGARGFAAVALGIVADKEMLPWNSKISADINYVATTSTLTDPGGTGILDIL